MLVCQWHSILSTASGAGMAAPQFRKHSEALAPYIVPGFQHWVVYRVLDPA
jgi:hypothetical protein